MFCFSGYYNFPFPAQILIAAKERWCEKDKIKLGAHTFIDFLTSCRRVWFQRAAQPDEPLNEENAGEEEQGTVEEPKLGGSIILSHHHLLKTVDF